MKTADNSTDFLCERLLKQKNEALHILYRNSVFAVEKLLTHYKLVFPFFTDHTFLHAEQVINYSNLILGKKNAELLSAEELYILLMAACLHDSGMGISEKDFQEIAPEVPGLPDYIAAQPESSTKERIRAYHNEFSVGFIRKYHELFEIPDGGFVHCICQVARGHRKIDLMDPEVMERVYLLQNGAPVRLAYLSAVVRLADEMDVTSNRNLLFDYDHYQYDSAYQALCFKVHRAIKQIYPENGTLCILYDAAVEQHVLDEVNLISEKLEQTVKECQRVMEQYTEFEVLYTGVKPVPLQDMQA